MNILQLVQLVQLVVVALAAGGFVLATWQFCRVSFSAHAQGAEKVERINENWQLAFIFSLVLYAFGALMFFVWIELWNPGREAIANVLGETLPFFLATIGMVLYGSIAAKAARWMLRRRFTRS